MVYFTRPGRMPSPLMVSALSLSMASENTSGALPVSSISCPASSFAAISAV